MAETDTIELLKECDSGTKMAVATFDEVLERISNSKLKDLLCESKKHHEKLGNEIHSLLNKLHSEEQDPTPMAKGMSWIKTNIMMTMNESDATVADLITDGCNMGVKSLHKYLNHYKGASNPAKDICKRLVSIEAKLSEDLRIYL